jgi:phosphoglycolate phosphatase
MKWMIFLDLDGTLLETSERHYLTYRDIVHRLGIQVSFTKEDFWNRKRGGRKTLSLLPKGASERIKKKFKAEWMRNIEKKTYLAHDRLVPGARGSLRKLKHEARIVLITLRHSKRNLLWELDRLKIREYFEEILVGSPVIEKEKERLIRDYIVRSSSGENLAIVGDTETEIAAGKAVGIVTIAVPTGIRSRAFLRREKPKYMINDLSELPLLLRKR